MTVAYLQPKHSHRVAGTLAGHLRHPKGADHINALIRRWQDYSDLEARNEVIERNLRFVANCARQYHGALTFEEAMSEGTIGMITALDRFDTERGFRFISYAVHWIRQAISAAQPEHGHIIRQPAHLVSLRMRINRHRERLGQTCHRRVTVDEAEEDLELSEQQRRYLESFVAMHSSLDTELDTDKPKRRTIADTIAAPDDELDDDLSAALALLHTLPAREESILRRYFGIGLEHGETLEAIGATIGLTRERVRQLRDRALVELRERFARLNGHDRAQFSHVDRGDDPIPNG